jgi:ferric-dicitrate binding protein FerR (iron transport regulator)
MTTDLHLYELLAAYLSENISGAEKASVEKWIAASEENQLFFIEIHQLWQSSGARLRYRDLDSLQLLHELQARIREQQHPLKKTTYH